MGVNDFTYNTREAYPRGVSSSLTGVRKGRRDYPQIRSVGRLRARLGLFDETVFRAFKRHAKCLYLCKRSRAGLTKTRDRRLWDETIWDLAQSPYLPPVVRKAITRLPQQQFDQAKRYGWHALDSFLLMESKHWECKLSQSLLAMDQMLERDPKWADWRTLG